MTNHCRDVLDHYIAQEKENRSAPDELSLLIVSNASSIVNGEIAVYSFLSIADASMRYAAWLCVEQMSLWDEVQEVADNWQKDKS